jgi:DNA-binding transcriptional ArsR family regulator
MTDQPTNVNTTLLWDWGTAYELFISLEVLNNPSLYGLRASWAAGVRSRIPAVERKLLEEVIPFIGIPMSWLYDLAEPKDAIAAMWSMRQIPPAERMIKVLGLEKEKDDYQKILLRIARLSHWNETDLEEFYAYICKHEACTLKREEASRFLDRWAKPAEFGEGYLAALQSYHQVFFEEEEKRIGPILKQQLEYARQLATRMSVPELLVELSQGVSMDDFYASREIVLIPAFWSTPLIMYGQTTEGRMIVMFGARPAGMSAIPGEIIPESLMRSLKALSDPSRLKILHYLSKEELTPSELARRLHLRAPTVTHHLGDLRLAGLVNLTIKGQEKYYSVRRENIRNTCAQIESFLDQ